MKNDEIKNIAEDEVINESSIEEKENNSIEAVEEIKADSEQVDENNSLLETAEVSEDKQSHKGKIAEFINEILSVMLDQLVMLIVSLVTLIVFNFLIKFAGYHVVMPVPVLFIIYFIIGCLYMPVFKKTKWHKTIGQKLIHTN